MDRIRKALDLARERRDQPPSPCGENPRSSVAAEAAPARSAPVDKSPPVVSIVEKPKPAAAIESAAPVLAIVEKSQPSVEKPQPLIEKPQQAVEKPQPVVAAVESHGSLLRSVERLRPVATVAKPVLSTVQRHPPGDWEPPRPITAAAVEQPIPAFKTVEMPRASATAGEAAPTAPTAIQYTKTKTFSPNSEWLQSNRIVDVSGSDAAAGAFRMLRTQVLQRMLEHKWRSIAVLSPGSDDGRTTTAMNLAISLANDQRHTVLLVEFDLKQPIMAKRLGIDAEVGADDVLRGSAGIEDCLYHPDGFDRFVVMPARMPMERSSEMLAGPRCRAIVAELRSRYPDRLLVFDLPPVLGTDDALAFVPLVECALIVVAERSTRRADLLRCMELLRNTPIIGTVLNLSTGAGAAYG